MTRFVAFWCGVVVVFAPSCQRAGDGVTVAPIRPAENVAAPPTASSASGAVETKAPGRRRTLFVGAMGSVCVARKGRLFCTEARSHPPEAVGIADSMMHHCVWTERGEAFCAGYNKDGRVGVGRKSDAEPLTKVEGLEGVVEMAVGARSACARLKDGTAWCWGDEASTSPQKVEGLTGVVRVTSSQTEERCFLTDDGTLRVRKWGQRDGAETALTGLVDIGDCWSEARCGLRRDGSVACARPAYGSSMGMSSRPELAKVDVSSIAGAVQIATGPTWACALLGDGSVACFGDNSEGQLGEGSKGRHDDVVHVPGIRGAREIATGLDATCVLRGDESVWCWGSRRGDPSPRQVLTGTK